MPKRVATDSKDQGELEETNDEGGKISTTASDQLAEVAELPVEPTASTSTTVRKFRPAWKNSYPWLQHDEDKGMLCSIWVKHTQKNNVFTKGTDNFRSSTLERHVSHHVKSIKTIIGIKNSKTLKLT